MLENPEYLENELEPIPDKTKQPFLWWHHLILFGVGYLTLNLLAIIFRELPYFYNLSNDAHGILAATLFNVLIYLITFAVFAIILIYVRAFIPLFKGFTKLRPYIAGLFYGFVVIVASVSYNVLVNLIFGPSESNANQSSIEAMIKVKPALNFLWIVILGPLVEELTYRVGLFNGLKKVNRILAYVLSGLIFGLIHFTVPYNDGGGVDRAKLIVEFINIPSYIISGLLFAYIYDKEGFATSTVAHVTNNLLSFIITVINAFNG